MSGKSTSKPKYGRVPLLFWTALSCITAIYVSYKIANSDFNPKEYILATPPELKNRLSPNNRLRAAELLLYGSIKGPESLLVEEQTIYTGTADGRVLKITNGKIEKEIRFTTESNCGSYHTEPACGRPLGIRRLNAEQLIVADAYLGIFVLNFHNNKVENVLRPTDKNFNGIPPKFFNDLDVLDADTIFFSDSSLRWDRRRFLYPLLEQQNDGRVFKFNLRTKTLEILLSGLNFPNGVQIHPNRNSVLVAECGRARVLRYYFMGPRNGDMEIFTENLPGFPDNIRLSVDGTALYIALAGIRHKDKTSFLDQLSGFPMIRKLVVDLIPAEWLSSLFQLLKPNYGIFIVADPHSGEIIDSLHDSGGIFNDISQVSDDSRFYYLGSFHANFIGKVSKKHFKQS